MGKYLITLNDQYMEKFSIPFDICYSNGEEIDFNNEGIGLIPSVEIKNIPDYLYSMIEEKSFHREESGIFFGPITEGNEIIVEKGSVDVHIMDTSTIISKKEFFEILLQMAHKALEAVDVFQLKEKRLVDHWWIDRVKYAIPQIEAKLKNTL